MKKKPTPMPTGAELRRLAEARLSARGSGTEQQASAAETRRLLHELQVHQIELEMQNEELLSSRAEVESLLGDYTDLYDFAPVGYITLARNGTIDGVNLTGAGMLGLERARLLGRRFGDFVMESDLLALDAFLADVYGTDVRQVCDIELRIKDRPRMIVRIDATLSPDGSACRAAMIDVTERRMAVKSLKQAKVELESHVRERTAELRLANGSLMAIRECSAALGRADSEAELLDSICRIIAGKWSSRLVWVGFPKHDAEKSVVPVAMEGLATEYLETARISWADTARGRGPVGVATRTLKIAICRDTQSDPSFGPWKEVAAKNGYLSVVVVPLVWEGECLGALSIYSGKTDAFSADDLDLLTQFGADLTFGIVALRTRADRERFQQELLEVGDEERGRIGRDLHDGVCQQLCAVQIYSELLARELPLGAPGAAELVQITDQIRAALKDTRMLSRGLLPVALEAHGLVAGLEELVMNTETLSRVTCRFYCDESLEVEIEDGAIAIHLYRIAQEAIQNALKHGEAETITVTLGSVGGKSMLEIVNDGCAMVPGSEKTSGIGFRSMKYRAELIGGTLEIGSTEEEGMRVACVF